MSRYMLDTNTVSHLVKGHALVAQHMVALPMADLCISSITEAELLFGLAKRPTAKRLHLAVREFLRRVDVLPWDHASADRYGPARAELERRGKVIAPLDLLIGTHALSLGSVLVSNDKAFGMLAGLVVDWTV